MSQSRYMLPPDQITLEATMSPFEQAITDHAEIVSWVSKQHGHIPVTDPAFMMSLPPHEPDDEGSEFDWD